MVHLLSFKKGGKIQTGLNCEYDGLSKVVLSLSRSRELFFLFFFSFSFFVCLCVLSKQKIVAKNSHIYRAQPCLICNICHAFLHHNFSLFVTLYQYQDGCHQEKDVKS